MSLQEQRNLANQYSSLHFVSLEKLSANLDLQTKSVRVLSRFSQKRMDQSKLWSPISLLEFKRTCSVRSYNTNAFSHLDSSSRARKVDDQYSSSHFVSLETLRSKLSANLDLQSKSVRVLIRFSQKTMDHLKPISLPEFKRTCSVRSYSTNAFSHLDSSGRARMVDVSRKRVTVRTAVAECNLIVGDELLKLLKDGALPKGDALGVARIAGVMAAKKTSELIPLCHPLPLDYVNLSIELPEKDNSVHITCEVRVTARTGAEMEALSGCSGAALALYDMCKAVDKEMVISDLRVVRKTGGKSDYPPPKTPEFPPTETSKPVEWPKETFAPINFAYL